MGYSCWSPSRTQLTLRPFQQRPTDFEPFRSENQSCTEVMVTVVWPPASLTPGPGEVPTQLYGKVSLDYVTHRFYFSYHLLIISRR